MIDERGAASAPVADVLSVRGLAGKRDYVRSLESRHDEAALVALVECLRDESWYLRELAEAALLRVGAAAGPAVTPLLGQGLWYTRASAARVLGHMGHGEAAPALVALTRDRVDSVAREACRALARLAAQGGAVRIAWEVHRLPPEQRPEWFARLAGFDRPLAERLERVARVGSLMSLADPSALRDDAPAVRRALEEESRWEVPGTMEPSPR